MSVSGTFLFVQPLQNIEPQPVRSAADSVSFASVREGCVPTVNTGSFFKGELHQNSDYQVKLSILGKV